MSKTHIFAFNVSYIRMCFIRQLHFDKQVEQNLTFDLEVP